ncbi:unnamed protein product, partial [Mesorhabditis spiculigera]
MTCNDKVICLIDMDCFFAQVEQREKPELLGLPVAVFQASASRSGVGGIIALSYEAKNLGVRRGMNQQEAFAVCKDLKPCVVPFAEHLRKPDIQKYRNASKEVFDVLQNFFKGVVVEKASIDEAFIDLTPLVDKKLHEDRTGYLERFEPRLGALDSTHLADGTDLDENYDRAVLMKKWYHEYCKMDNDHLRMLIASEMVDALRKAILDKTKFQCSAGISTNKMLAKLACARHKPRQQTILPHAFCMKILDDTPIEDVRYLGGLTGANIREVLNIQTMGELAAVPLATLEEVCPDKANWLYRTSRGFSDEPVKPRHLVSSIATSKQFAGRSALVSVAKVREWLSGLAKELCKRLNEDRTTNRRTATKIVLSYSQPDRHSSKTLPLNTYDPTNIFETTMAAFESALRSEIRGDSCPSITCLTLSASHFALPSLHEQQKTMSEWVEKRRLERQERMMPTTSNRNPDDLDWEFLQELPEDIRAEVLHERNLEKAKKLKMKANVEEPKAKAPEKRKRKAEPPKKEVISKKLDTFFKKR